MKISHEVPKCLMQESRSFNDFDYALVHKFNEDKEYFEFFQESLKQGRNVILDNSIFELEEMFDHNEFAQHIEQLVSIGIPVENNFHYIVPDSLEHKDETIESFKAFVKAHPNLPGKTIGVVQGKTLEELLECYKFMAENADTIAISFDYSWYETVATNQKTKWHSWMRGRQLFVQYLKDSNLLSSKPHHLLGCSLPSEFLYYKNFPEITSCDTSNPIVHAIKGIQYTEAGLEFKESIKLVDLFDTAEADINKAILDYNIKTFRKFCN